MKPRILFLLTITCLLSACGLSDQQKSDYASVRRSGVSPAIYDKMVHDDPLSINDVVALSRARVSDGVIVRYIRDHDTVYSLNGQDYDHLRQDGVSPSVIDFMARTGNGYGGGPGVYVAPPPIAIGLGFGFGGGGHWH